MKKRLVASLAAAMVLGVAGTSFAATAESVLDKVDINGAARIRYDHQKNAGVIAQNINLDIFYSYKVNDEWSIKGESEFNRNLRSTLGDAPNDNQFEQLYITGPIAGTTIKAGKISYLPTYGVVFDDKFRGAQVSFGNVVKTTLNVGKTDANKLIDSEYQAIDFTYPVSKDTNIKANFQKEKTTANVSNNYFEAGFDTKLSNDFGLQAAYAKSNADTFNKAYIAQVQYKAADTNVVGSSDIYVAYRKFDVNATIAATGDYTGNFKGVRIGYDYVPMKNAKIGTWYMDGKTSDAAAADKKIFRAQVELFF